MLNSGIEEQIEQKKLGLNGILPGEAEFKDLKGSI